MRVQRGSVLVGALACLLAGAATATADTDIQGNPTGKPDLDVRTGRLAPTKAQRSDVADLQAQAAWNQFGTPSSLVRPGGDPRRGGRRSRCGGRRARLAIGQPLAVSPLLPRRADRRRRQ